MVKQPTPPVGVNYKEASVRSESSAELVYRLQSWDETVHDESHAS